MAVPPSSDADEVAVAVQDELQLDPQRELQSVVQSMVGGLAVHCVVQSDSQLDVHVASAVAVHCESHVCSS